jgi:hypothetical protein
MNRIAFSIALVGLGVLAGLFVSSGRAEQAIAVRGSDAEKLAALRKERRDVLSDAVERQYIWFRTGVAFSVAAIGILISTIAAIAVFDNTPSIPWVQLPLVFAVFAIGILPAFLVERWYCSRKSSRRNDAD